MKRISILLLAVCLNGGILARAQDAVEERYNKLTGQIEELQAAKVEQDKRIAALVREVEALREQVARPAGNYASTEDVRKLTEVVQEVDRKRVADNEQIAKQIDIVIKAASSAGKAERPTGKRSVTPTPTGKGGNSGRETGYEYEITSGDTLSTIAEAYRTKGVKVTAEEILKANPGLKERSLQVGQKIFIPAP